MRLKKTKNKKKSSVATKTTYKTTAGKERVIVKKAAVKKVKKAQAKKVIIKITSKPAVVKIGKVRQFFVKKEWKKPATTVIKTKTTKIPFKELTPEVQKITVNVTTPVRPAKNEQDLPQRGPFVDIPQVPPTATEKVRPIPATAPKRVAPRSAYVLDLKKINFEKHVEDTKKGQTVSGYYQQLKNDLSAGKQKVNNFTSEFTNKLPKKNDQSVVHPVINFPKETVVSNIDLSQYLKPKPAKQPIELSKYFKSTADKQPKAPKLPRSTRPSLLLVLKNKFNISAIFENFAISTYGRRAVASFVLASFLLVSPLWAFDFYQKLQDQKGRVLGVTSEALKHLKQSKSASQSNDFTSAQNELTLAEERFAAAQSELESLPALANTIIAALPQGSQLKTGTNLLTIAQKATSFASSLVNLFSSSSDEQNLISKLSPAITTLQQRHDDIKEIRQLFSELDYSAIPAEYRQQLEAMSSIFTNLTEHVDELLEQASLIENLLGANGPKRYLLIFQNNNELRATGGFIGSYALLDINRGQIKKLDIPHGGVYDLRAGLKANIEPPHSLTALNPRWEFQDTNYFADFPASAKKIMSFYQKSGGTTVDGVIAVNATFLKRILSLTGPVKIEGSDITVDEQNVQVQLENEVEFGENKEKNVPKKIIADLTASVLEQVSHKKIKLQKIAATLLDSLSEKELQLYLTDEKLQAVISKHLWSGEVMETSGDYLNIVSTNIAGGKTNNYLQDSIKLDVSINDGGEVINTLRLTRTHSGTIGDRLSGIKNNDYIRFYLPLNSQLISANGFEPIPADAFQEAGYALTPDQDIQLQNTTKIINQDSKTEIYQEGDKTVFANWIQINPQETKTVTIKYKLPFSLKNLTETDSVKNNNWWSFISNEVRSQGPDISSYSLLLQKQSGKLAQKYELSIHTPDNLDYVWSYPSTIEQKDRDFNLTIDSLEKDSILGVVFQSK